MTWWQQRMACFDLETTATDPEEARIVTGTVALVGGGLVTQEFSVLVNPGVPIPEDAQAIHGVSTERAERDGLDPAVGVPGLSAALGAAVEAGYAVVPFNARYDLTVLDREMVRHARWSHVATWRELSKRMLVIDPLEIDQFLDRYRPGSRKLDAICEHYRAPVRVTDEHEADHDAISAGRLAWCLGHHGRVIRRPPRSSAEARELRALHEEWARVKDDLPALHEAQRRWAYDRAVELEQYFHRGNPAKDVPPQPERQVAKEWPVIPAQHDAAMSAAGKENDGDCD